VSKNDLVAPFQVERYGDFWLTDAVRPAPQSKVTPRQGFRLDTFRDPAAGIQVPVAAAAVSRERLFDLFLDLLDPLGEEVHVILESSHDSNGTHHHDLHREHIDLPVLKSHLCDFEDLLLHDGCTGVAVVSSGEPMEVQFDEHKLLLVYAHDLTPFTRVLTAAGIPRNNRLRLITEGEHLHSTDERYREEFEHLCYRLGVSEAAEPVSW
jgi:hypothetical protein